jgi:hypothetical protein
MICAAPSAGNHARGSAAVNRVKSTVDPVNESHGRPLTIRQAALAAVLREQ